MSIVKDWRATNKNRKFVVEYGNTAPVQFRYRGESAREVLEKFSNRKGFGNELIHDYRIDMVDADTRGKQWIKAHTIGDDCNRRILVWEDII